MHCWVAHLSSTLQVYMTGFLTMLPVTGKLKFSKMSLKHPNLYLYETLTEDMVQFLITATLPTYILTMLASTVRQGELFPGEIFLTKICVSISVLLNIAVSVK